MSKASWVAAIAVIALSAGACSAPTAGSNTPASASAAPATSAASQSSAPAGTASSASSSTSTASPQPSASTTEPVALELPRGGREVFPQYRLVGYSGLTGAPTLGRLGTGPLDQRVREMERRAAPYGGSREVLPVLEIIATIVHPNPGPDGLYRSRLSDADIATYHRAARKHKALLLLNIQPGRSSFLKEVKSFERWLREPDVGVALDPEWAMQPGQIPGRVYGRTTGRELNGVSRYLSGLVERHQLPEKVMVYHQVASYVVRQEAGLKDQPGVAVVKSVDGIGSRGAKEATYRVVTKTTPKFVHAGFKLFYTEDRRSGPLMTPKQVLALKPRPEYVLYE